MRLMMWSVSMGSADVDTILVRFRQCWVQPYRFELVMAHACWHGCRGLFAYGLFEFENGKENRYRLIVFVLLLGNVVPLPVQAVFTSEYLVSPSA